MEEEQSSMLFEQLVMREIKFLTTKLDDLQHQVLGITQRLDDHLGTCHPPPRDYLHHQVLGISQRLDGHLGTCHPPPRDNDLHPGPGPQSQTGARRRWHTSEDHKQTCLRKSLQMNILLLVDNLPFSESELADMLISADCLTGDECADLRRCPARKDQVRNLVRLIKGRSFKVMRDFLNCLNHISPDIARKIWTTYSENLKSLKPANVCTYCSLRHSVDIKLLADHVWSIGVMSDGLYDEIAACLQPGESQWRKMAIECNQSKNAKRAIGVICGALERKGHYKGLVSKLRRKTELECCCLTIQTASMTNAHPLPEVYVEDCDSSVSPNSSVGGDFERSLLSDISSHEDLTSMKYTDVLDYALSHNDKHDDGLVSGFTQGIHRGFLSRQMSDTFDVNINLLRVRSNSFGKSSGVQRPLSKRRASMIN